MVCIGLLQLVIMALVDWLMGYQVAHKDKEDHDGPEEKGAQVAVRKEAHEHHPTHPYHEHENRR